MHNDHLTFIRTIAIVASATTAGAARGEIWSWMNDPSAYGYFCQYSIPNALNDESCAPSSATNALQFVQTTYAAQLGGVQLVGSGYGGWNATAQTLQVFFGTTEDGSSGPGQTAGLSNYLSSIGAADLVTLDAVAFDTSDEYPEWVTQDTTPTFGDFYAWMAGGAGVFFDIAYGGGGTGPGEVSGHALALVGLEWDDADGDGVVDQSEGAKFLAIDPLDPSQNYAGSEVLGPPKVTSVSIWQTGAGQELQFSYLQYQGELPFDASNYAIASGFVSGGASISVIPAPAAWIAPLAIGIFRTGRRRFGRPVS